MEESVVSNLVYVEVGLKVFQFDLEFHVCKKNYRKVLLISKYVYSILSFIFFKLHDTIYFTIRLRKTKNKKNKTKSSPRHGYSSFQLKCRAF